MTQHISQPGAAQSINQSLTEAAKQTFNTGTLSIIIFVLVILYIWIWLHKPQTAKRITFIMVEVIQRSFEILAKLIYKTIFGIARAAKWIIKKIFGK